MPINNIGQESDMKTVKQFFERINVNVNIRSHLAKHDDFLFYSKNLYRLHFHLVLSECE